MKAATTLGAACLRFAWVPATLVLCAGVSCAGAHGYVVTLKDGQAIHVPEFPALDPRSGLYEAHDASGKTWNFPENQVVSIVPTRDLAP